MDENMKRLELIITALQKRMGDLVSSYETQMAILRSDATIEIDRMSKAIEDLNKQIGDMSNAVNSEPVKVAKNVK